MSVYYNETHMAAFEEIIRGAELARPSRQQRYQLAAHAIAYQLNEYDIVKFNALNEQLRQFEAIGSAGRGGISFFSRPAQEEVGLPETEYEHDDDQYGTGSLIEYNNIELAEMRLDIALQAAMTEYDISNRGMRRVIAKARRLKLHDLEP